MDKLKLANGGVNLRPGCMVVRLLAGYRLFTTRDRESSRKSFFRDFFALKVFDVKTKAKMLKISAGFP